jgi:hypothetical protein
MSKAIKATTLNKSGKSAAKSDLAALGRSLVDAAHNVAQAKKALEADYLAKRGTVEAPLLTLLRTKASEHIGMTAATYDKEVHPAVIARYTDLGYKMAKAEAAKLKVAFLAFCHGVEPSKDTATNVQKFVNVEARKELGAKGVIKYTPKGAAGKTKAAPEKKAATPAVALTKMFDGDKVARKWRADAIEAILAHDPQAKLFDAMLSDLLDTLEIEID